jgi:hypothetical protein
MSRTRVFLAALLIAGSGLGAGFLPSAKNKDLRNWPDLVVKGDSNSVFQVAVSFGNRTLFSTYRLAPDGAPGELRHGLNTFDGGSLTVERRIGSYRFHPSMEITGMQVRNLSSTSAVFVTAVMNRFPKGEVGLVSSNQYVSMHLKEGQLMTISDSTNFVLAGQSPVLSGGLSSATIELFE